MELKSKITQIKNNLKAKEHSISILRHTAQIVVFFLINYLILEFIFQINLLALEGIIKVLPFLHSPRNLVSTGSGIVEYIFYSLAEGIFPVFLIAILIIVLLLTNRFFCGWICPIGTIQDACSVIGKKKRRSIKKNTHEKLVKIKYIPVIILTLLMVPLTITIVVNNSFYNDFKASLGGIAGNPIGYFSLSDFLFYTLPTLIMQSIQAGSIVPFFSNGFLLLMYIFYLAVLIGSIWYPRVYCRYFCPYGAISSLFSRFSFLKLTRSPVKCVGRGECGICERECPKQVRILDEPFEFFNGKGECNFCLKCKELCPYKAINIKFG